MRVVAITNNKGGVGKTAMTVLLAASLARRQRRVLCIDMDPQANLSRRLGFVNDPRNPVPTLAEAIRADAPGCAADIVTHCHWKDPTAALVDLLPARFDLENRIAEAGTPGAAGRLDTVVGNVADPYDWVLIDCPPSLGHLTQMSLVMTGRERPGQRPGYVLVVVEPELDAGLGAQRVREFVGQYAGRLGVPGLRIGGMIVNRVRPTELHTATVADLREAFGPLVWEPMIPLWTVLADAQTSTVPLHALPGEKPATLTSHFDALAARMEQT